MTVTVPNLIGLGRAAAEAQLDALRLRHIARFPFDARGDGSATEQIPAAGTEVLKYSVVTVSYPSPLGPVPDTPVLGPISGTMDGLIYGMVVDRSGASISFSSADQETLSLVLYRDQPVPLLPRAEWMRRGAMLSLAQRAFTNRHNVRLVVADSFVQSIEIFFGM